MVGAFVGLCSLTLELIPGDGLLPHQVSWPRPPALYQRLRLVQFLLQASLPGGRHVPLPPKHIPITAQGNSNSLAFVCDAQGLRIQWDFSFTHRR